MSLDFHLSLAAARVVLDLGLLLAWYLLFRLTTQGTQVGMPVSAVSTFCHRALLAAWLLGVLANGLMSDSESLVLSVGRLGIALTFVTGIVAWAVVERRRRSAVVRVGTR